MAKLIICPWFWGQKYSPSYIWKLQRAFREHLHQAHEFLPITDRDLEINGAQRYRLMPKEDRYLLDHKGCFARLRMFDPVWQDSIGAKPGDRIVSVDLDVVGIKDFDTLFNRPEPFVILQGANAVNPCPYNGSLWMFRAGYRPDVWTDFSLEAASKIPYMEFPDDQGWFAHKLPGEAGWKVGAPSGVYGFQKPGWPKGDGLPGDARMVVFFGWRDPSKFVHLNWVKENWR